VGRRGSTRTASRRCTTAGHQPAPNTAASRGRQGNQGDGGLGGFQLGDRGGMSSVGDTLTGALPQVSDFLPSPATNAPNVDASINIHSPVGVSPNDLMSRIHAERNDRARTAGSGLKGVGGF